MKVSTRNVLKKVSKAMEDAGAGNDSVMPTPVKKGAGKKRKAGQTEDDAEVKPKGKRGRPKKVKVDAAAAAGGKSTPPEIWKWDMGLTFITDLDDGSEGGVKVKEEPELNGGDPFDEFIQT